jgi:hypothetical protein
VYLTWLEDELEYIFPQLVAEYRDNPTVEKRLELCECAEMIVPFNVFEYPGHDVIGRLIDVLMNWSSSYAKLVIIRMANDMGGFDTKVIGTSWENIKYVLELEHMGVLTPSQSKKAIRLILEGVECVLDLVCYESSDDVVVNFVRNLRELIPEDVDCYVESGSPKVENFLVGFVMKNLDPKPNPNTVRTVIREHLTNHSE